MRTSEGTRKFLTGIEKAASILCEARFKYSALPQDTPRGLVRDHPASLVLLLGAALGREGAL